MKFVTISDTHGQHRDLMLPSGEVIIHAGDFCHYGSEYDMYDFLNWFKALAYDEKILIGGNHDFFADEQSEKFKDIIPQGITYLNDNGITYKGIKI